jgi:hypothetical protein
MSNEGHVVVERAPGRTRSVEGIGLGFDPKTCRHRPATGPRAAWVNLEMITE